MDNFHSSGRVALKIVLTPNRTGVTITQPKIEAEATETFFQKQKEANYQIRNQPREVESLGEEIQVEVLIHQEYILAEVEEAVNLAYAEIVV